MMAALKNITASVYSSRSQNSYGNEPLIAPRNMKALFYRSTHIINNHHGTLYGYIAYSNPFHY
jgi:hypothetical protein